MEPTINSLAVTSVPAPWNDSYQMNYSDLSSPWRPWMHDTYALTDYVNYDQTSYYPIERKFIPPSKRMRLQDDIALDSNYSYYYHTENQEDTSVLGQNSHDGNTVRGCYDLQPQLQDLQNSLFVSSGISSYPVSNPQHIASDGEMLIPTKETLYEIVEEDQTTTKPPTIGISVVQPDGSQTSLWNWQSIQQLQQDDQPLNPVPSFKSICSFAGTGVPTRRRGRQGKSSTCHMCNKIFESSYKLKLHMFSHTGEKPYVCDICGKGFSRGTNLNQHLRVHSSAAFPCKYCDRAFRNPSDRLVHILTKACTRGYSHLQHTPHGWVCLTCDDKSFSTKDQAERHARTHEQGKGMLCPVCNQNFQGEKPNVLVRHVKKQHRDYIPSIDL